MEPVVVFVALVRRERVRPNTFTTFEIFEDPLALSFPQFWMVRYRTGGLTDGRRAVLGCIDADCSC